MPAKSAKKSTTNAPSNDTSNALVTAHAQRSHDIAANACPDLCDPEVEFDDDADPANEGWRIMHDLAVAEGGAECPGLEGTEFSNSGGRNGPPNEVDGVEAVTDSENGNVEFRNWTQEDRDALDPSDFGGPSKTFPIADQTDVDAAAKLIGRAKNPDAIKAKIIKIAKRKGLTLPESWQEKSATDAKTGALFSVGTDAAGNLNPDIVRFSAIIPTTGRRTEGQFNIYPDAILFEAGNFPDKKFSMTREELFIASDCFGLPVAGNIEHTEFMKGRACEARSVRIDPANPDILRGEVAVLTALDALLTDAERRLSCEWSHKDKELRGLALTVNPRVKKAALMAAFSAGPVAEVTTAELDELFGDVRDSPGFQAILNNIPALAVAFGMSGGGDGGGGNKTIGGQSLLQRLHDQAAESGALCKENIAKMNLAVGTENRTFDLTDTKFLSTTKFHTAPELDSIQKIHDSACQGGATCRTMSDDDIRLRSPWFSSFASFTDRQRSEHADKHHQLIHDAVACGYPGVCSTGSMAPPGTMAPPMGMGGTGGASEVGSGGAGTGATAPFSDTPEQLKALKSIHGMTVEHGAKCPGCSTKTTKMSDNDTATATETTNTFANLIHLFARNNMDRYATFRAALTKLTDKSTQSDYLVAFREIPREDIETLAKEAPPDPLAAFADNPHFKAQQAELNQLKAERDAEKLAKAKETAVTFAKTQANRLLLLPETVAALEVVAFAAAEADRTAAAATVTFSASGKDTTLKLGEAWQKVIAAIPENPNAAQIVQADGKLPGEFKIFSHETARMSAAEEEEQHFKDLEATPLGQATAARLRAQKANMSAASGSR